MTDITIGRRAFLAGSAAISTLAMQTQSAQAGDTDTFNYEITRTPEEWRVRLSPIEHYVLREGGTEAPRTSPLWNSKEVGTYSCRGCDLTIYDSFQKLELDKGWVFFRHSRADTVMLGVDLGQGEPGDPFAEMRAMMEAHCRRCGSHLGHIVALPDVPNRPIHCINGFSLKFEAKSA